MSAALRANLSASTSTESAKSPGRDCRLHRRGSPKTKRLRRRRGYTDLHVAVEDYSRVAHVEVLDEENAVMLCWSRQRGQKSLRANDITVGAVLADNPALAVACINTEPESLVDRYDTRRQDYAVQPSAVGIRTWSYDAKGGDSIKRLHWVGKCFRLFLSRRFVEPDIDPCPWCEIYPRHDGRRILDEVTSDAHESADLDGDEINGDL